MTKIFPAIAIFHSTVGSHKDHFHENKIMLLIYSMPFHTETENIDHSRHLNEIYVPSPLYIKPRTHRAKSKGKANIFFGVCRFLCFLLFVDLFLFSLDANRPLMLMEIGKKLLGDSKQYPFPFFLS